MVDNDNLMDQLKEKIKQELKAEILAEITRDLNAEASEPLNSNSTNDEMMAELHPITNNAAEIKVPKKESNEILISTKAFLKMASHALKYANKKIPQNKWVEVIGLIAGKLDNDQLILEDAYPMGHGNAIHAEIKDYKNYAKAFTDISENHLFVCGWYHSHPSYGPFMSTEDMGTQNRYQRLWDKAVALVIDPYQINGTSYGFEIYRSDFKKYYSCPFKFKGGLSQQELPELLEFINPIVDGKALFLEYDE